jgi:hypothetical protein
LKDDAHQKQFLQISKIVRRCRGSCSTVCIISEKP